MKTREKKMAVLEPERETESELEEGLQPSVLLSVSVKGNSRLKMRHNYDINTVIQVVVTVFSVLLSFLLTLKATKLATVGGWEYFSIFMISGIFGLLFSVARAGKTTLFIRAVLIDSLAIVVLLGWLLFDRAFTGLKIIAASAVSVYNHFYLQSFNLPKYTLTGEAIEHYTVISLVLVLAVFGIIFAYVLSDKRGLVLGGAVTAGLFWVNTNIVESPDYIALIAVAVSFFLIFYCCGPIKRKRLNKDKLADNDLIAAFIPDKKSKWLILNHAVRSRVNGITTMLLLLLVVALAVLLVWLPMRGKTAYKAPLEEIGRNPALAVEFIRQSFTTNNGFIPFMSAPGISGGNLSGNGFRQNGTGETHLIVSAQNPMPMLLKGYVGSVYTGSRWINLDGAAYNDSQKVFDDMHESKFTPMTIIKSLARQAGLNNVEIEATSSPVFIQNLKANHKYSYYPYLLSADGFNNFYYDEKDFLYDYQIKGRWSSEKANPVPVFVPFYDDDRPNLDVDLSMLYGNSDNPEYMKYTADYAAFVYKNYLQIPNGEFDQLISDAKALKEAAGQNNRAKKARGKVDGVGLTQRALMTGGVTTDFGYEYTSVIDYLRQHALYDLSPGAVPANNDFVNYFLYENHRGYCTHFATAATLLYRAMGIPARYVEGYIVTGFDYDKNFTPEQVEIPDKNAHAWVEIWDDRLSPYIGWIPIEVTPGFNEYSVAPEVHDATVDEKMKASASSSTEETQVSSLPSSEESSSEISSKPSSEEASSEVQSSSSEAVSDSSQSDAGGGGAAFVFPLWLKISLAVLAALLLLLALILVLRRLTQIRRERRFTDRDTNKSIRSIYEYAEALLSFIDIRKEAFEGESELAARADELCKFTALMQGGFAKLTGLALEAKFSSHIISGEICVEERKAVEKLAESLFESLSLIKKIKFLYINRL